MRFGVKGIGVNMKHRMSLVIAIASAVALSGCNSHTDNAVSSTAAPVSVSATIAFDDPVASYRELQNILHDFYKIADYSDFPTTLTEVVTDPYLGQLEKQMLDDGAQGIRIPDADMVNIQIQVNRQQESADLATVQACLDARNIHSYDWNGRDLGTGNLTHEIADLRLVDGRFKVYQVNSTVVESCPFS